MTAIPAPMKDLEPYAPVTVKQLQDLLPTELYEGSKDWREANLVGRVEWLISMYESMKSERDDLLATLADINSGDPV